MRKLHTYIHTHTHSRSLSPDNCVSTLVEGDGLTLSNRDDLVLLLSTSNDTVQGLLEVNHVDGGLQERQRTMYTLEGCCEPSLSRSVYRTELMAVHVRDRLCQAVMAVWHHEL